MANETIKVASSGIKQAAKAGGKTSGTIVYNPYLDSWRCLDATGRQVLSTGSKEAALAAYPNFTVKE